MGAASIFVSYRIADTLDLADRLAAELQRQFGRDAVFFDRRTVEPGDTWDADIKTAASNARVMLVLIGKRWLTTQDDYGERRLSLPEDWVRLEVETALQGTARVIPVLVDGVPMPPKQAFRNLPSLEPLASQQATRLCTEQWDTQYSKLADTLVASGIPRLPADTPGTKASSANSGTPAIPPGYRDWVADELADISLLGLDPKDGRVATLRQVYVPALTRPAAGEGLKDREARNELVGVIARLDNQSLYVPGAPGAGKTTLCKWLALLMTAEQMPDQASETPEEYREAFPESLRGRLPVLCRLRDFYPKHTWQADEARFSASELQQALATWVDGERPGGLDGDTFARFLDAGQALLMLDGFDEVASSLAVGGGHAYPRAALLAGLKNALPGWQAAGNRVLLTSRPYGLTAAESRSLGLDAAPLAPLPPPLQRLFIQRWFATVSEHAKKRAAGLWGELQGRKDLAALRDNPMLLTAICVKYQEGSRLPADIAEMYSALVSKVLHNRYDKESAKVEAARRRLGVIALTANCGRYLDERDCAPTPDLSPEPAAELPFDDIDRALRAHNESERLSSDRDFATLAVREDLLSNSGLLMPGGEQAAVFYHLSIQDFLAAERLQGLGANTADWLAHFAGEPRWRQAFGFWFGRLMRPPGSPARALRAMATLAGYLNAASLNDNPAPGLLWSDCLELAGAKLDDLGHFATEYRSASHEALTGVEQPATRARLFDVLGTLGLDDRPGIGLRANGLPDIDWVAIPGGDFLYGEDKQPEAVEAFEMARYPVTNAQYQAFIDAGGYGEDGWWQGLAERVESPQPSRWSEANRPRTDVSWYEAVAYCRWLRDALGRDVRLPTEQEWERAARGTDGRAFPWGDGYREGHANVDETEGERGPHYLAETAAPGLYPQGASPDGLQDMAGNVWEWCSTDYENPANTDTVGEATRVLRGGSWFNYPDDARCWARYADHPNVRYHNIGFRLSCSPPSKR